MNNFQKQLKIFDSQDGEILYDVTFVEALYSSKRYLRCQTDSGQFQVFDIAVDSIYELQSLHEKEFVGLNWDATNNIEDFD